MNFKEIQKKIKDHVFLTEEEGLALYDRGSLYDLGELAQELRIRAHGRKTYYIRNRHIDYSNLCVLNCAFCAFPRKKGMKGSFDYSIQEIVRKAREALAQEVCELHIVGGLHPDHPFEFYLDMLREIKRIAPKIHLKCFTAIEINYFSRRFKQPVTKILEALVCAGLDSLPGGGAEILVPELRKKLCRPKGPPERWLTVHRMAHGLGLKSTATMLYGHIERPRDWFAHMALIRELQSSTHGFLAFIPLAFNPKGTLYESKGTTSGVMDLKVLALARLFLPNIPHLKAYWVMSGMGIAQLSQDFGVDDLHGTVIEENIAAMAGGHSPQGLSVSQLEGFIRESGYEPVERDSFYQEVLT